MLTETRVATAPVATPDGESKITFLIIATAIIATILAVFAYRAAAADYFTGDDFVYLQWLQIAWAEPVKLWTVFWSNSLEASSTHFYRPLLSLSMALDKEIWGTNALGFHVTNLFFHSLSSGLIFLFVRDILLPKKCAPNLRLWPLFSAGIFLLHPLHPEVVTWIGGRVDTVATTFFLSALYTFARWRSSDSVIWFRAAMTSFILCLCSKELSVMVPATLFAFEWILPRQQTQNKATKFRQCLSKTAKFWIGLVVYFIVRRISLGTFVGGYDNSLSIGPDLSGFATLWMNSLSMMLVPINVGLLSDRSALPLITWVTATTIQLVSLFKTYLVNSQLRPTINFLFTALVLFLIPVYKLMSIAADLESSRLAYLATAPLSCLLALGTCTVLFSRGRIVVAWLAGLTSLLLSAYFLHLNNVAWQKAGVASNSIQHTFRELQKQRIGKCIIFGLPDNLWGAYVCRNALGQMHDNSLTVVTMPAPSDLFSTAFSKEAVVSAHIPEILTFSTEDLRLKPMLSPQPSITSERRFSGEQLQEVFLNRDQIGKDGLHVRDCLPKLMKLPDSRSAIDAIVLQVATSKSMPAGNLGVVYNNEFFGPDFMPGQELAVAEPNNSTTTSSQRADRFIVFPMRGRWTWQFDGKTANTIHLCSGSKWTGTIKSVSFSPLRTVAPIVSFFDASNLDIRTHPGQPQQRGLLRLSQEQPEATLHVDASGVVGAKKVLIEISRKDIRFDYPNAASANNDQFPHKIVLDSTIKDMTVTPALFGQGSRRIHTIRAWALNDNNQTIGIASDHIPVETGN